MIAEEAKQKTAGQTTDLSERYRKYLQTKTVKEVKIVENVEYADSDYIVYIDGKLHHYLEIKVRNNVFTEYAQTKVPLRKHSTAEHYLNATGIKSYFLAAFSDGVIAILNLSNEPDLVGNQLARADRGEGQDVYAFYNISNFQKLDI